MFKDRFLHVLEENQNVEKSDVEIKRAIRKIKKQKRLSSQEFLKVYDSLWKEGPQTKYTSRETWAGELQSTRHLPGF